MPTIRLLQSGDGNALKAICDSSQAGRIAEFGEARGYTRADLIALSQSGATLAVFLDDANKLRGGMLLVPVDGGNYHMADEWTDPSLTPIQRWNIFKAMLLWCAQRVPDTTLVNGKVKTGGAMYQLLDPLFPTRETVGPLTRFYTTAAEAKAVL